MFFSRLPRNTLMQASDPYWSYVRMLMHFDSNGTTFVDSSGYSNSWTATGNATQSATQSKFGGKSLYCDGTGDYITHSATQFNSFGTADWTFELFVYFNALVGTCSVFAIDDNYSPFELQTNGTSLICYSSTNGTSWNISNPLTIGTIVTGQWYHVAIARNGATLRTYLNGIAGGTGNCSTLSYTQSQTSFRLGSRASGSASNCYIDDVRLTVGICRYPSGTAFTPPTEAFPNN